MKGADCRLGTGAGTWVEGGETGDGGGGGVRESSVGRVEQFNLATRSKCSEPLTPLP